MVPQFNTIAFLGSYVPRQCGIATFTKHLRDAIAASAEGLQTFVLAVDDNPQGHPYGPEVRFQLQVNRPEDYRTAAELLNIKQIDIFNLQHEFGIYGGRCGEHVLTFLRRLRMPIVSTLHTVLQEPSREQKAILREVAHLSDRLVVMAVKAVEILQEVYDVPREKIVMIPHGIHNLPFTDSSFYKGRFGLDDRTVILTFGLLSPGKGIEVAIRALPQIVARHPEVMYMVVGATHPHIFRREGVAYLNSLERLAERLGVGDHVSFHHRFVSENELAGYLGAADLYLTPYLGQAQITSGTLAYAMGAGKAVVSTPYWYAEEMLAEDRGRLFPFGDSEALAAVVNELLDDEAKRNAMRKRAYLFTRPMLWNHVANRYVELGREILAQRQEHPRLIVSRPERRPVESIPEVNMAHLQALTDDTGILQHAIYTIPDRNHGYCTDDNARALLAALEYYDLAQDDAILRYVRLYTAFVWHAFDPARRRFRNFMSYDRRWLDETGTDDTQGRALWALGRMTALSANKNALAFSSRLFCEAIEDVESLTSPRSWAMILLGAHSYLERFPGDTMVRRVRQRLAERLYALFTKCSSEDWPWCEDTLTYINATIPHALILAGAALPDESMREQGLRSLEWLVNLQLDEQGIVSLIGNRGWMSRDGHRAGFDQQPVEAQALVDGCAAAYCVTRQPIWRERAHRFLGWFLGHNDTRSVLYDFATGGCHDGLHPDGPNLNQGAESTLAWLLSLMTVRRADLDTESYHGDSEKRHEGGAAHPPVISNE